jgi:hypothetical protein
VTANDDSGLSVELTRTEKSEEKMEDAAGGEGDAPPEESSDESPTSAATDYVSSQRNKKMGVM